MPRSNAAMALPTLAKTRLTEFLALSSMPSQAATISADPAGAATIILINAVLFVLAFSAMAREAIQIVQFRMLD